MSLFHSPQLLTSCFREKIFLNSIFFFIMGIWDHSDRERIFFYATMALHNPKSM